MKEFVLVVLGGLAINFLWSFFKWCYQKLYTSKKSGFLLYDLKEYKIGNDDKIEILCLWNPSDRDIKKSEITKDFEYKFYTEVTVESIKSTDQRLRSFIQSSNQILEFNFKIFPSKSGGIYILKSKYSASLILLASGEINGEKIKSYDRYSMEKEYSIAGGVFNIIVSGMICCFSLPWIVGGINPLLPTTFSFKILAVLIFILLCAKSFFSIFNRLHDIIFKTYQKPPYLTKAFNGKD